MTNYDKVIVEHVAFKGGGKVAEVMVEKNDNVYAQLEKAYMLTQNIENGWWHNENVKNISGKDAVRSTSVEDVMHVKGKKYMVDIVGFKQIN